MLDRNRVSDDSADLDDVDVRVVAALENGCRVVVAALVSGGFVVSAALRDRDHLGVARLVNGGGLIDARLRHGCFARVRTAHREALIDENGAADDVLQHGRGVVGAGLLDASRLAAASLLGHVGVVAAAFLVDGRDRVVALLRNGGAVFSGRSSARVELINIGVVVVAGLSDNARVQSDCRAGSRAVRLIDCRGVFSDRLRDVRIAGVAERLVNRGFLIGARLCHVGRAGESRARKNEGQSGPGQKLDTHADKSPVLRPDPPTRRAPKLPQPLCPRGPD